MCSMLEPQKFGLSTAADEISKLRLALVEISEEADSEVSRFLAREALGTFKTYIQTVPVVPVKDRLDDMWIGPGQVQGKPVNTDLKPK